MTIKPLRVGVAGVAHVHAPGYIIESKKITGAQFVGVWDDQPARAQQAAQTYDTRAFATIDELLSNIDTLVIAGENSMHHPVALAAATRRIPTLCEKPLAPSVAQAREMIDAFAKAGVQLGTAFPVRYSPAVQRLRQTIQSGSLGETLLVRATNRGTYPGGWFGDPNLAGGGAIMDHTVHVADIVRWIWQQEFNDVYAEGGTMMYDIKVDDCGMLLFTLENGLAISLDPSWSRPSPSFPTWGDVTMEITAENGVVNLDAFGPRIELFSNRTGKGHWVGQGINLDHLMISDWLDAVRHGKPAPISGVDGLRAVELVEAAYRSVKSHQPEKVIVHPY